MACCLCCKREPIWGWTRVIRWAIYSKPMQKHFDSEKSVWWIAAWSVDMIRTCRKEAIRLLELKWKPQLIHQADYANLKASQFSKDYQPVKNCIFKKKFQCLWICIESVTVYFKTNLKNIFRQISLKYLLFVIWTWSLSWILEINDNKFEILIVRYAT